MKGRVIIWVVGLIWGIFLSGCTAHEQRGKLVYEQYCGGCHQLPSPSMLSKSVWETTVLPEMASRLGLSINGYDPYEGLSWINKSLISQTQTYPEQPLISIEEYTQLHQYLLANAPEKLEEGIRPAVKQPTQLFEEESISLDQKAGSDISMIQYDPLYHEFKIGTIGGLLIRLGDETRDTVAKTYSPVVSWDYLGDEEVIAEIGILPPSQIREGTLGLRKGDNIIPFANTLHRPVDFHVADLDGNGTEEIVVCEYGDYTGSLTLWVQNEVGKYTSESLLDLPGAIRVVAEDMDDDEKLDLVVAYGQGKEGVIIFYQEDSLTFRPEQVIEESALFGTSWMEVVDFDFDGDLDLVLAQGDNADYSYELKPYHGVRLYLNDGANHFEENFFFPLYGATRILVRDFDEDGDMDLVACAYFPDFQEGREEAVIYLDNQDGESFVPHKVALAEHGRWITAEAGDYDGDGDLDILLGSFTHTPTPVPTEVKQIWNAPDAPDLLLLRNVLR